MAITRGVGPIYIALNSQSSNSGTLTGTTIGRSIVIVLQFYDPSSDVIPTITISGESNATPIAASKFTNHAGSNGSGQIFYLANNTTGGNKTITVSVSSGYAETAVMEYAGMDTGSQPDNATAATGVTSDPSTSLVTTTANALIVAGAFGNSNDFTAGSGYALFGGAGMGTILCVGAESEDQVDAGTAASKTVAFTGYGAAWAITAASFKIAGGAGTTPKTFTATDSLAGGELL